VLIGSIKIGGQQMRQFVLIRGFTITHDIQTRTGLATLLVVARPADVMPIVTETGGLIGETEIGATIFGGPTEPPQSIILAQASVEIWKGSGEGTVGTLFDSPTGDATFGGALFGGETEDELAFSGTVTRITPRALSKDQEGEPGTGYTEYTLECQDYTSLLDTAVPPPVTLPTGSDQDAIRFLIAHTDLAGIIDTTDIDHIADLDYLQLTGITVRQALDNICNLTGGYYRVDYNKALHYKSPTGTEPPFNISDSPDGVTSFPGLWNLYDYSEDFSNPGNRILVFGGGSPAISVEVNDATSQATYGRVFTRTFRDENLLTDTAVLARANVELARFKYPQKSGRVTIREEGLDVGMLVAITNRSLGISGNFLIRRLVMTWLSKSETLFALDFGDFQPDLIRYLRQLSFLTGQQPSFNSHIEQFDASTTWTVPDGLVGPVSIEVWGAAGNGGSQGGGGGGGGAYANIKLPLVPGTVITLNVAAGGSEGLTWAVTAATVAADAGIHGEDGIFVFGTGLGGRGGRAADSIGTVVIAGVDGTASPDGLTGGVGGAGGNGGAGGAGGGPGLPAVPPAQDGTAPGGGGGGGGRDTAGGVGAAGRIKLTYSTL